MNQEIPKTLEERIERIKRLYPQDYDNHIQNMNHNSETGQLNLPDDTIYIDTTRPEKMIEQQQLVSIKMQFLSFQILSYLNE